LLLFFAFNSALLMRDILAMEKPNSPNSEPPVSDHSTQYKIKSRHIVALQNPNAKAYISIDIGTDQQVSDYVRLVDISKNRDQKSTFIIDYYETPELGKPAMATIKHLISRKYLSITGDSVSTIEAPYKWNITEVGGGDVLISVSEQDYTKYLSSDTLNNLIIERVSEAVVRNTGKPTEAPKRYQWNRIIAARITNTLAKRIAGVLNMPIATEN